MQQSQERLAPSRHEMALFVSRLEHLVMEERDTQKQRLYSQWSMPLSRRVSDGKALYPLHVVNIERGVLCLHCAKNESRFREGDLVRLSRGDPFEEPAYDATLEREDGPYLWLTFEDREVNWGLFASNAMSWIIDEGFLDLSDFYLQTLEEVAASSVGRTRLLPMLLRTLPPQIDDRAYQAVTNWSRCQPTPPNPKQEEALAYAFATDSYYLIQGPPGTGKTHVLALLARRLAEEGERVLVTSFTHRAINNALNKCVQLAPHLLVAKIGSGTPARTDDLEVDNYTSFKDSPMAEMSGGYIIGATPFATRTSRLRGVQFDTIIFDEASQVTLPLALMGMLKGTEQARFIFIGDHKQMPPVLVTHGPDTLVRQSVFAALKAQLDREDDSSTMLNITYRMNETLTAWPSQIFYHHALRPDPIVRERRLNYSTAPRRYRTILDRNKAKVFVDLAHRDTSVVSVEEADVVVTLVQALLEAGILAEEIGVIAPYRAQGRAIRKRLHLLYPEDSITRRLVVDTVERMQGQERDVILLSLTTSSAAFANGLAEFFFQPERLNVSITRARSKLIIVGSRHLFDIEPDEPMARRYAALMRSLLASCTLLSWNS